MTNDVLRLIHILERIERVQAYTASVSKSEFLRSPITQDAVKLNLESLAETSRHLSSGLREAHPEIDWNRIYGVRVLLMYDCLGIDPTLLWNTLDHDLPELKAAVTAILENNGTDRQK